MKTIFAVTAALLCVAASTANAQETRIPAGMFTNTQTPDQYLAQNNLIGAKIHGADGTIVGDIEDLIVNDYNQIVGVIMGTGGFLGIGEKKVGVNLSALKFVDEDGKTTITLPQATPEIIAAAEPYETTQPRKSLLERAKEKAEELKDKTTATSEKAVDDSKPALEKAKDAFEKAKEAAGPALDAAKEAVQKGLDTAKEALEGAGEAASTAIDTAKDAATPNAADGAPNDTAPSNGAEANDPTKP